MPAKPLEASRMRWWAGAAIAAFAVPVAFSAWTLARPRDESPSVALGVRLGMTASQVRQRFARPGTWFTEVDGRGGQTLRWSGQPGDPLRGATFEFHEGLLVALRAEAEEDYESLERASRHISELVVREVTTRANGVRTLRVIARSCPVHQDEVSAILGAQR